MPKLTLRAGRALRQAYNQKSHRFKTIYALSSSITDRGSPIAVIRVSGKEASVAIAALTLQSTVPKPRVCCVRNIYHRQTKELFDKAVVVWYSRPHSYTGEDMCELFVHGAKAVVACVLKALGSIDSLSLAEPGDFTRRALLNGKVDVVAAEAVGELISSQTDAQRKRALGALSGRTKVLYERWRENLIQIMAHVEANIDFGEDELLDGELMNNAIGSLKLRKQEIVNYLDASKRSSLLIKDGVMVVIVGPPNVGQISL